MTQRNCRGAYVNFTHDRAADWEWLAKWQPNVIRYMGQGQAGNPNSFDVNRVKRIHDTCPDATILLRCWEIDDNNFKAHDAMVADPVAEAERQVDWWDFVMGRAQAAGVPRELLMAGLNNETGPEKDGALFDYTEAALRLGIARGVRLGVFVFSVGRPALAGESKYDIGYFSRLDSLIQQNKGAVILHQYMQPEGMYAVWTDDKGNERKDWTYLMGRDLRWQIKSPIIIGEWGIDGILYNRHPDPKFGNSGWRNFKDLWPPNRYADEYVECIRKASDNVIAICPFIEDWGDHKWQSFDLIDAYGEFLARKDLCVKEVTDTHTVFIPAAGSGKTTTLYVTAPAGLYLRAEAKLDGASLGRVPYGEQVTALGDLEGQWVRVQHDDKTGYMYRTYLSATQPQPVTVPSEGPEPTPQPQGDNWTRSIAFVRRWEGVWADDPNDPGGATNKGITLGTYTRWRSAHGQPAPTKDDLRSISDAEVSQIYREWYWQASGADRLPWPLALACFDTAVNAGVGKAQEVLQKSNGNFLAYMGLLIDFYARIDGFEHFGRAWMRRRADLLLEAAK